MDSHSNIYLENKIISTAEDSKRNRTISIFSVDLFSSSSRAGVRYIKMWSKRSKSL